MEVQCHYREANNGFQKAKLMGITWRQRITKEAVKQKIRDLIREYEPLQEVARRRKLQWFVHTTRGPGSLAHDEMHGLVEGARGGRRPERTRPTFIVEWTRVGIIACAKEAEK